MTVERGIADLRRWLGRGIQTKIDFWANCLLPAQHKAVPEQKNCAPFKAVDPLFRTDMLMKIPNGRANKLLGAFTKEARDRIMPHMKEVDLKLGTTVCEAGGLLTHAYFPQGCVMSLLTVLENGSEIECANIGREGAFGLFAAMYGRVSFSRCTVQLRGPMIRCDIRPLKVEFENSAHMQDLFVSYSETLLSQVMQTVACNSLHTVEKRLCRWLLMMHDRAEGENLTYTHEFLARVMGVHRTSVTLAAQSLQNKGLIRYRRGMMQVVDRLGLEEEACECYSVVKERFDAFLNPPSTAFQKTKGGRT